MSTTSDFLQQNQFTFFFDKLPNTMLRLQRCPIPKTWMTHSQIGTPFSFLKQPDTKLQFDTLPVSFKLDENFEAYLDIFNWLRGLGNPDTFLEYAEWWKGDNKNLFSDCTLSVYTNENLPNIRVTFKDAFPTSLSEIQFDSTVNDAVFFDVTATFEYHSFTIEKIST